MAVKLVRDKIVIETARGELRADHLLLGTGAVFELEVRAELRHLAPAVLRWRDRCVPPPDEQDTILSGLPYLDDHYGFLPRQADHDWVARVICFNGASFVSHGPHSTSISGRRHCVPRVVRGITGRLFRQQQDRLLSRLTAFEGIELPLPEDFESKLLQGARLPESS
jgi:FAD-dependent urate hydroxylase